MNRYMETAPELDRNLGRCEVPIRQIFVHFLKVEEIAGCGFSSHARSLSSLGFVGIYLLQEGDCLQSAIFVAKSGACFIVKRVLQESSNIEDDNLISDPDNIELLDGAFKEYECILKTHKLHFP